jgi:hypothetical protein
MERGYKAYAMTLTTPTYDEGLNTATIAVDYTWYFDIRRNLTKPR